MKLTKTQVAWLKNSRGSKDTRPTFWTAFWSVRKAWLVGIALMIFGIGEFVSDAVVVGCILVSQGWGFVFASVMLARRAVALWPVFHEVTDWERVQTLIREQDERGA